MERNLIMGCAAGYDWPQVEIFVRSLASAGFDGDLCLLVHRGSALYEYQNGWPFRMHLSVVERRLQALPPSFKYRRFHGPKLRVVHERHVGWVRRLPVSERLRAQIIGWVSRMYLHIGCSRYSYYLDWLRKRGDKYLKVLLTDVRDVAFQASPFNEELPGELVLFLESAAYLYGGDNPDTVWASVAYGDDYVARVGGKRVSCCGTVMGTLTGIIAYLEQMTVAMAEASPRIMGTMIDQVVHNYLIINEMFTCRLHKAENWAGPVLNMGSEHGIRSVDAHEGLILNPDGSLISVLHQYDRYESIFRSLRERWCGSDFEAKA